jgi:hypothetical protein
MDLPVVRPTPPPALLLESGRRVDPRGLSPDPTPLPAPGGPEKDPRDEPPPVFFGEEIDSEGGSIVFVIDRSGSMDEPMRPVQRGLGPDGQSVVLGEDSPTRMEVARRELVRCISSLERSMRFNIYAYDCGTLRWSHDLQPADADRKASACAWVSALFAGGATGTGPATAYALGEHRECVSYVLLTDGEPNCGADPHHHRRQIADANTQHAAITVFGIAATAGHRAFCQQVASDSGGSYYDVN